MLGTFKKSPAQRQAIDQVTAWTRARFALPQDTAIVVLEIACGSPGCPPLETLIAFWTDGTTRHQFRVFKPAAQVGEDDLPPRWMKDALIAIEDPGCCG